MHTVFVVGGGFAALLAVSLLGHAWGGGRPGLVLGAKLFIVLWLIGAFFNMWLGTRHGYSWAEEFPIFLAIFSVPAAVATLLWWRLG